MNSDELIAEMEQRHKTMVENDQLSRKAGILVGRYIKEQYADGYAFYEITREYKNKVRIKWLDIYVGWVIPYWGKEATIDKAYALRDIEYRDGISKLFRKRN
jgi:hypothetical protein